jgi:hypothetical protein
MRRTPEVGGGLVARGLGGLDQLLAAFATSLLIGDQHLDHLRRRRDALRLLDLRELRELPVAARRVLAEARMRSAISSTASASSVYCVSNRVWSVVNIGPVTFQWKLWVFR